MDRDRKMIKLQKTILNCPVSLISHLKAICLRLLWYTDCPIQLNWNTLEIQQMTFKTFTHELCYYWQSLLESNRYLIKQQDAANLRPPSTQSSIPELRSVKAGTNSVLNMLGYSSCSNHLSFFHSSIKNPPQFITRYLCEGMSGARTQIYLCYWTVWRAQDVFIIPGGVQVLEGG